MNSKQLSLAAVAIAALAAQPAIAADVPAPRVSYKAPPVAAPVPNWTGWYVGAGGGYGLFDADNGSLYTTVPPGSLTFSSAGSTTGGKGYFGRVQTGFDY